MEVQVPRLVGRVIVGFPPVAVLTLTFGMATSPTLSLAGPAGNPACPVVQVVEPTRHHDATRQVVEQLCGTSLDRTSSAGSPV